MNYDWVESGSQTQSDTTTDSYAAVPAVEQPDNLQRPTKNVRGRVIRQPTPNK